LISRGAGAKVGYPPFEFGRLVGPTGEQFVGQANRLQLIHQATIETVVELLDPGFGLPRGRFVEPSVKREHSVGNQVGQFAAGSARGAKANSGDSAAAHDGTFMKQCGRVELDDASVRLHEIAQRRRGIGNLNTAQRNAVADEIDARIRHFDPSADAALAGIDDLAFNRPGYQKMRGCEQAQESKRPGQHMTPTDCAGSFHQAALRSIGASASSPSTWNGSITRKRAAAASCRRL
jgi:hypothetical protein